jgi:non-specific serine/threonine protein kinase
MPLGSAPESTPEGSFDVFPLPLRNVVQASPPPVARTSFIGREQEIERLQHVLQRGDVSLITLTGPGGVGKTRIAIRAINLANAPVHFIDLSDVRQPALVLPAIAAALGVSPAGRPIIESLASALRDEDRLLVLDNFEQVLPAATGIAGLLAHCPRVKLLVTSRAVLGIPGEHVVDIRPLAVPPLQTAISDAQAAGYDGCRLFIDRARALAPDFTLDDTNAQAIASICRRLDGLPLAIELAAAWISVLSPATLVSQLEHCLALPGNGSVGMPSRHRTMQETIAWSYGLISPTAQGLFRRLAVFNGGCTLDAILDVCGGGSPAVLHDLRVLVANSLVRRVDSSGGDSRYMMLETVREFGMAQLATDEDAATIRKRHAEHFLKLARQAELKMSTHERDRALGRLDPEAGNLQGALAWAIEAEHAELALDLFGTLLPYWQFHFQSGAGRDWERRSRALTRNVSGAVLRKALFCAGTLDYMHGDVRSAKIRLTEARARYESDDDQIMIGRCELGLGRIAWDGNDLATARTWFDAASERFDVCGDIEGLAQSLHYAGLVSWSDGDYARAATCLRDALRLWQSLGFDWELACCIPGHLADVAAAAGDYASAAVLYRECLAKNWPRRDSENVAWSLAGLASLSLLDGRSEQAARLMALADRFRDLTAAPLTPHIDRDHHRIAHRVIERVGVDHYAMVQAAVSTTDLELEIAAALATPWRHQPPEPQSTTGLDLTQREREVLRLIAAGKSNLDIAGTLFLSPGTVKVHVTHILGKLGVKSRSAATDFAHRNGLA